MSSQEPVATSCATAKLEEIEPQVTQLPAKEPPRPKKQARPILSGNNFGLREVTRQVVDKLHVRPCTSYEEIARELAAQYVYGPNCSHSVSDEKNLRRRAYDVLNVMAAVGELQKLPKKRVRYVGNRTLDDLIAERTDREARIAAKQRDLQALRDELFAKGLQSGHIKIEGKVTDQDFFQDEPIGDDLPEAEVVEDELPELGSEIDRELPAPNDYESDSNHFDAVSQDHYQENPFFAAQQYAALPDHGSIVAVNQPLMSNYITPDQLAPMMPSYFIEFSPESELCNNRHNLPLTQYVQRYAC